MVANKLAVGVGLVPMEIVLRTAILSLFVFHYNVDKNLIAVISYLKHTPPIKIGGYGRTCTFTLILMRDMFHYLNYITIGGGLRT